MTVALATALSVMVITAFAWAAKRLSRARICPICLGVGGTWLWMLVARYFGVAVDTTMLPVLLGGSAVGVAYALEKRLPEGRSALLWKNLFIPAGLVAAYAIALPSWAVLGAAVGALLVVSLAFFLPLRTRPKDNVAIERLQEQMKKCC